MEFLRQEVLNNKQTDRQRQRETETEGREVDRQTEGRKRKKTVALTSIHVKGF